MLDSKAVFEARLVSAGMEAGFIRLLLAAGIDTIANMAYCSSSQPGTGDEVSFIKFLCKAFALQEDEITTALLAMMRRVWYESHAIALAEVRSKVDRTEDAQPKRLAMPERAARMADQQRRLSGVSISGSLEPSFAILDYVNQMKEDEQVKWIDPSLCTARESELQGVKKETFMKVDAQGNLKAVEREVENRADMSNEYRIRLALQRRSLALDQANLLLYAESEAYHNFLFALLTKPVPDSHMAISVQQVLQTDMFIWTKMSEHCRRGISMRLDGTFPIAQALTIALADPIILSGLQPLQIWSQAARQPQHAAMPGATVQSPISKKIKVKGKGKGKQRENKGKGKGKPSFEGPPMPKDLIGYKRVDSSGRNLCFAFNINGCSSGDAGAACTKGSHACCKCLGAHCLKNCNQ